MPGDWEPWKRPIPSFEVRTHDNNRVTLNMSDMSNNLSDCKIDGRFISPDIESISYKSNGKTLDGNIWLTDPFLEPPVNDTLDTFQEELIINVTEENKPLETYTAFKLSDLNLVDIKVENFTLSEKPANKIVYNSSINDKLGNLNIWTVYGNKSYDILFTYEKSKYDNYLQKAMNMINSLIIKEKGYQAVNQTNQQEKTYEDRNIKIDYPSEWVPIKTQVGNVSVLKLKSPYEDLRGMQPSWHEIAFIMAVDLTSVYDAGTDYRIIYTRMPEGLWTGNWTRQEEEVSAYDKEGFMNETINTSVINKTSPARVPFSFDLENINYPEQYKVLFNIVDTFVINHQVCRLVDTSNWVIVPPPHFTIKTSPNSAVLMPGEEKNVNVEIGGIKNLPAEASFSIDSIPNGVNTTFTPDNVTIPSSSNGTTTLRIKVLNNNSVSVPTEDILPIKANISFPTTITNRGGDTFSNNKSVNLNESSSFTLTLQPGYTDSQKLANFVHSWIDPISGLWTFLAGIGTAISPLIIYLYKNRHKKGEEQDNAKANAKADKSYGSKD